MYFHLQTQFHYLIYLFSYLLPLYSHPLPLLTLNRSILISVCSEFSPLRNCNKAQQPFGRFEHFTNLSQLFKNNQLVCWNNPNRVFLKQTRKRFWLFCENLDWSMMMINRRRWTSKKCKQQSKYFSPKLPLYIVKLFF